MPGIVVIIILAVVQGITEFLPISSSGHLALLGQFFGIQEIFDLAVYLHLGTLLSIITVFYRPIGRMIRGVLKGRIVIDRRVKITDRYLRVFLLLILGSIPAALAGFLLKNTVEQSFGSPAVIGAGLLITGIVLLATKFARNRELPNRWRRALVIGVFQALAIFPGISRSGMTISAGLFQGMDPAEVFEFSFLLAIPAMLGANLTEFKNITASIDFASIVVGVTVSYAVGVGALLGLKKLLIRKSFYLFSIYCLLAGMLVLLGASRGLGGR